MTLIKFDKGRKVCPTTYAIQSGSSNLTANLLTRKGRVLLMKLLIHRANFAWRLKAYHLSSLMHHTDREVGRYGKLCITYRIAT